MFHSTGHCAKPARPSSALTSRTTSRSRVDPSRGSRRSAGWNVPTSIASSSSSAFPPGARKKAAELKIVILGAGQVGSSVAEGLVSEHNDITVVDLDPQRLRALQDRLDLRTLMGSASHPSVLKDAGIEDADMVIAVTQDDETNLVACKLAQQLFNVPTRIARI